MNLYLKKSFVCYMVLLLMISVATPAAELGRLFTTKEERNMLDKLRYEKPVEIQIEDVVEEEVVEVEEKPEIGSISINGLVYRKNGKSTAWINRENTYEGNIGIQYLRIKPENINPEHVELEIPFSKERIQLEVGETYNPSAGETVDLTGDYGK